MPWKSLSACWYGGEANLAELREHFSFGRRPVTVVAVLVLAAFGVFAHGAPSIAPNTTERAYQRAHGAVVKLYGASLGREHGYGTGFLISPEGRIITVQTLLTAGRSLRVVTSDGRQYEARVVRTDDTRKLAELQIEGKDLPCLPPAESSQVLPGDSVIAMGNWFKVAEGDEAVSVNRGVLGLRTTMDARRLTQDVDYRGPILVYDAITGNPGAPGGPLLDIDGNCIGIIGQIVEAAATNTRLNYALPSEEILAFLGGEPAAGATTQPADGAPAGEPYLGIRLSKLGFRHVSAYVERVASDSPAAEAGIQADDLIVSVDGERVTDADSYNAAVERLLPGRRIQVIVKRGQQLLRADLVVGEKK